jgi:hypothetical protein
MTQPSKYLKITGYSSYIFHEMLALQVEWNIVSVAVPRLPPGVPTRSKHRISFFYVLLSRADYVSTGKKRQELFRNLRRFLPDCKASYVRRQYSFMCILQWLWDWVTEVRMVYVRFFLCLIKHQGCKAREGGECILNIGTWRRWMINFTP